MDSELSDEHLARGAQTGSIEDFEELARRHEARVFRFLARSCRNEADGADLTQETFVSAYRNLHRYDPKQPFATWLFTIARRKCIDHFRTRRATSWEESGPEQVDGDDQGALVERKERGLDVWRRVQAALPELHFQVVWFKYVEELSVEEIARVLGRTKTHVKVILFRSRKALAEVFREARLQDGGLGKDLA